MTKRNRTTLEVETELAAKLSLPPSAVGLPALKDKVAVAVQHGTVRFRGRPPPERLSGRGWSAELLGFLPRPLSPKDLLANRFVVTLRDLGPGEAEAVRACFHAVAQDGFPNYFDLQRFGSWSAKLGFPGKLLLLRRWEDALWAYLAEPLAGDAPSLSRFKKIAQEHWGNWKLLKEKAPRGNPRSVLTFLCDHPEDYKRAVNLVTPRVLALWLSAYQSFLWNQTASRTLRALGEGQPLRELRFPWGEVAVPCHPLAPGFRQRLLPLTIPLPFAQALAKPSEEDAAAEESEEEGASSAGRLGKAAPQNFLPPDEVVEGGRGIIFQFLHEVLTEEGLAPRDLKARGLARAYLPRGTRALWVVPAEPVLGEPEPDDLFPGRQKLRLSFTLPPGAYATLLLRLLSSKDSLSPHPTE